MNAEKQKENFEDTPITTEELARMTNVGFTDTQRQINELSESLDALKEDVAAVSAKLDVIIENMATKDDVKKLSGRVTELELQAE